MHESSSGKKVFIQVFNPPLRLIVVGAVHITQALVPVARLAGYEVIVVDPRRAWTTDTRFPDVTVSEQWPDEAMLELDPDMHSAIVTLSHDPKLDDPALHIALRSPAFYIGSLGSKRTHAARLQRLREAGFGDENMTRIHAPIGLDIGAKSPAEIAIAIMAQITQARHR
jgi:xanthine dehydrogenase accessory factor